MIINVKKKDVEFKPENIKDGFKLGMLRVKCQAKQVPVVLSFNVHDDEVVLLTINHDDLLTIMGINNI